MRSTPFLERHCIRRSVAAARSSLLCAGAGAIVGVACPAVAAPPSKDDYAQGAVIAPHAAAPIVELTAPDYVYRIVTRADLRDLRVFNADGAPVPHALCAAPETSAPLVKEHSAPVFELRTAPRASEGARIEVQTPAGAQVRMQESGAPDDAAARGGAHIIDVREIDQPLRAIQFDWASPDGASQASVRIEASDDLDRWERIVGSSTLLRAQAGTQTLRRERIETPLRAYKYLRVQRVDGGPPLVVRSVTAESVAPVVDVEPTWFLPNALVSAEPHILLFDTARAAPVGFARIRMTQANSAMRVILQSRAGENSPWRDRWSGEAYMVATGAQRRESPPARFAATADRYWRLLTPQDAAAAPRPIVEFGYRPLRVRFLTQGPGPYVLAYGSRRAELATPASCDGLLADVSAEERRRMIADAQLGAFQTLGGAAALKPPPKKTPARVIVLWSVLIAGVGLLVAMALSLLKRVRPTGSG